MACLHTFFAHAFLAVVCYRKTGNGAVLAGRRNNLYRIMAGLAVRGVDVLGQHNPLADNFTFLVDTAAETGFVPREDFIRKGSLNLLQVPFKGCLGDMVKDLVFYLFDGVVFM